MFKEDVSGQWSFVSCSERGCFVTAAPAPSADLYAFALDAVFYGRAIIPTPIRETPQTIRESVFQPKTCLGASEAQNAVKTILAGPAAQMTKDNGQLTFPARTVRDGK